MNHTIINTARNKAMQSNCKYKVAALGFNKKLELVCSYFNKHRYDHKGGGIHAEMQIMKNHPKSVKMILICRVGNNGGFLPIEPCDNCLVKSIELGIKIKTINN
jgi:hypothetical protein